MAYSTEERNEWRSNLFRKSNKPGERAHIAIQREHLANYAEKCIHPELVESFLKVLESDRYVEYRWIGGMQYGILTDSKYWVTFDRQVKAGDWALDRTAKLFMELKSGGYDFHVWGEWLESLRMHLVGTQILEANKEVGFLKAVVVFKSGDPFILTVCPKPQEFRKPPVVDRPNSKFFIEEPDNELDLT